MAVSPLSPRCSRSLACWTGWPFTVFAPTNQAFEDLDPGVYARLLADIPSLQNVLRYHVVPDRLTSSLVAERRLSALHTVHGDNLDLEAEPYRVNSVEVVGPDMMADNGVIHAIDRVLMPASMRTGWMPVGAMR